MAMWFLQLTYVRHVTVWCPIVVLACLEVVSSARTPSICNLLLAPILTHVLRHVWLDITPILPIWSVWSAMSPTVSNAQLYLNVPSVTPVFIHLKVHVTLHVHKATPLLPLTAFYNVFHARQDVKAVLSVSILVPCAAQTYKSTQTAIVSPFLTVVCPINT